VIYLDDLIIYNNNLKEHQKHVRKILQRLREIDLQTDIDKCEFHVFETKFLGMIIERDEIRMNLAKIQVIVKWENSRHLKEVQIFLSFINFYKRFIEEFFKLVKSLVNLTRKKQIFEWSSACETVFQNLKKKVTKAFVLIYFRLDLKIFFECDSFDYVFERILSQRSKNKLIRSVTYFSKTLSSIKCNYKIYDKELLIIIRCFEEWRVEL
jgi:hypothetical protein